MQVEAGRYAGQITDAQMTTSNNGNPSMAIRFSVSQRFDRDLNEWSALPESLERTVYIYFTDAAMEFARQKMEHLGFNNDFNNPAFSNDGTEELIELNCRVEVYKGKDQEKWDIAWGGNRPPDENAIADLSRRWGRPASAQTRSASDTNATASDRKTAWKQYATNAQVPSLAEFDRAVVTRQDSVGKRESDFDVADWEYVVDHASLPI